MTGDVEVGTAFRLPQAFGGVFGDTIADAQETCTNLANKCEDSRALGQAFTSLIGIVDFSFGVHRVSPRAVGDFGSTAFVAENSGTCPAQ